MKVLHACAAIAMVLAVAACNREGPAEKAGRSIDRAGEKASESMDRAGKAVRDAVTPDKK
jgi:predicted small lipoprotein YifL